LITADDEAGYSATDAGQAVVDNGGIQAAIDAGVIEDRSGKYVLVSPN
jgi:hydrogenase maturation factor